MSEFAVRLDKFLNKHFALSLALMAILHLTVLTGFIRNNSPTFDEPVHICGGINMLLNRDFRINPESGFLPQAWAAVLPVLSGNAKSFPKAESQLFNYNQWDFSKSWIYGAANYKDLYFQSRLMIAILCTALGILLCFIAAQSFGKIPAFMIAILYIFSPVFISNGALATADMAASFSFLISVLSLWKLFGEVSLKNILFAALSVSLLFLSKMSAVIIIPTAIVFIILKGIQRRALRMGNHKISGLFQCGIIRTAMLGFCGFCAFVSIWTAYGFRYSMSASQDGANAKRVELLTGNQQGFITEAVRTAAGLKIMPEAYLYGFLYSYQTSKERVSYFNGVISSKGNLWYFPYLFLVKNPPALLAAFLSGLVLLLLKGRYKMPILIPTGIFSIIYMYFALNSGLNIGFRHLMPVLPFVLLCCGLFFRYALHAESRYLKAAPFLLCLWMAAESLNSYPSSISYFNGLAGGSMNAHKYVSDSSLDWGQDLEKLKETLGDAANSENIYISYFGTAPVEIAGLKLIKNGGFFPQNEKYPYEYKPGLYCVSESFLRQTDKAPFSESEISNAKTVFYKLLDSEGNENKLKELLSRFRPEEINGAVRLFEHARLCALIQYLKPREPDTVAGDTIFVYKLAKEELRQALGNQYNR